MSDDGIGGYIVLIFFAVLIIGGIVYGVAYHSSVEYKVITVKEKWVKYHNNDAKYLVSDTNDNVYSIEDSWIFFTFDASNRYSKMETGSTYRVKLAGWRVPFLTWYQNIIDLSKE